MSAVESWLSPAAVAEPAPRPAPARRRAPERPAPQARSRRRHVHRRVRGHIVWMTAFAVMLAGVVAINVAVLRANVAVNRLDDRIAQLQNENQALAAQDSAANSAPQIEKAAHKLGLVQAPAQDTTYLDMRRGPR